MAALRLSVLLGRFFFAFVVNKFRIKIGSRLLFNGVKGNCNLFERAVIFDSVKNSKIQVRLHIQYATFTVTESNIK